MPPTGWVGAFAIISRHEIFPMDRYCSSPPAGRRLFYALGLFSEPRREFYGFFFGEEQLWPSGESADFFQRYHDPVFYYPEAVGQTGQYFCCCNNDRFCHQVLHPVYVLLSGALSRKEARYFPGAGCIVDCIFLSPFAGPSRQTGIGGLSDRVYSWINFATAKAQPAASAPITITRMAPASGRTPVSLLLKKPKTKRQQSVMAAEIFRPVKPSLTKK